MRVNGEADQEEPTAAEGAGGAGGGAEAPEATTLPGAVTGGGAGPSGSPDGSLRRLVVASTPGPAPAPPPADPVGGSPWRLPAPRPGAGGQQVGDEPASPLPSPAPASPLASSLPSPAPLPSSAPPSAPSSPLALPHPAGPDPRTGPVPPAEHGWRGAVRRLTGGLVAPGPGAEELRHRAARAAVRRSFTRPMTVVFANPKGGSGKTPATLLAAATMGLLRGGYVVAWDNNETRGTLGLRAQPDLTPATVWDLLANLPRFETLHARVGDLAVFLRHQEEQFDVLASDESPGGTAQIGHREYERVRALLCRFYKVLCVDTGDNVRASTWQSAIRSADVLVVCSTVQGDVGRSGLWMLDHLDRIGRHDLVANAVTVLSDAHPRTDPQVRRDLAERFAARTRDVVPVPYDAALAAGERIVHAELGRRTRRAWLHACASISDGLAAVDARPPVSRSVAAGRAEQRAAGQRAAGRPVAGQPAGRRSAG